MMGAPQALHRCGISAFGWIPEGLLGFCRKFEHHEAMIRLLRQSKMGTRAERLLLSSVEVL